MSTTKNVDKAVLNSLVAYPLTFYIISFICFIAYRFISDSFWFQSAYAASIGGLIMTLITSTVEMIDGIDDLIDERGFACRKFLSFAFKMKRVEQQPGQRILHFVSDLSCGASECGVAFLMNETFVGLDEFGGALSDARLEFFRVLFDFLLEPALLISEALLVCGTPNSIEQHVFDDRLGDEVIRARTHDLRYDRQVWFAGNHDDGNIYFGAT